MPTNASVDNGGPRLLYRFAQLDHFLSSAAAFNQIKHGEAKDDNKV